MKTSFTCLGILILALIFGRQQSARIADMEQRISSAKSVQNSKRFLRDPMSPEPAYRTKYQRRSTHAKAGDVFQTILILRAARTSVCAGPMAPTALENKEALQAIMQLDLAGLEELIQLVSKSKDPVFQREELVRCEQIVLCLTAIADTAPERAIELICHSKEQIGAFFPDRMWADPLLKYVLTRFSDRDPQGALNAMIRIVAETPRMMSMDSYSMKELLGVIARNDPGLVLDTIQNLPEPTRPGLVGSLAGQLETDDERSALFLASRNRSQSQPGAMEPVLTSLCERFGHSAVPSHETIALINRLGMTDEEKPLLLKVLRGTNVPDSGKQKFAEWLAAFLPDSSEKKLLLWRASWGWTGSDSAKFLKEQGIDPEEMMRREMGGN